MGRLFGTDGVRGVVNIELTPSLVYNLGRAIGTFFEGGEVLVGRDARVSGEMVKNHLIAGLLDSGVNVYYSGYAPTPAHQYAVRHYGLDGAVIATASHNPSEFNGIKVVGKMGVEVSRRDEGLIEDIYFSRRFASGRGAFRGLLDPIEPYVEAIVEKVDQASISRGDYLVIADPAASVGRVVGRVLERLGVSYRIINGQLDGRFPSREPEPLPSNLRELGRYVKMKKATFGVAYDGDADRSIFVDEHGRVIWGDRSGAMLSEHVLKKHGPGTLVVGVSASWVVEYAVKRSGGQVYWTKVGSVGITHKIIELSSKGLFAFGLEENGGFFYTPHQPVRDGAMSTALMLEAISKMGMTIAEYNATLPRTYSLKDKVRCPNHLKARVMGEIVERYSRMGYRYDTIDGIRVWLSETEWFMVRPSGTEPVIRIFAETLDEQKTKNLVEMAKREVGEIRDRLLNRT